jgi:WAS/WASL-interacting protein
VYFTAGGQLAGFGLSTHKGPIKGIGCFLWSFLHLTGAGLDEYWEDQKDGSWMVSVAFREPAIMCSGDVETAPVGTHVVVNQVHEIDLWGFFRISNADRFLQGTVNHMIPLTDTDALGTKWTNGSCLPKMGRHWGYDLATAPVLSGKV